MLKKVIPIVISLCLIFSISVMAENTRALNAPTMPQVSEKMPEGMGSFPGNIQNPNQNTKTEQEIGFWGFVKAYSTPITSVILLALAFIFVIFYRRKNY